MITLESVTLIINIGADIILAGGVIFIFLQAKYAKKQLLAYHDMERRKKALEIITNHTLNVEINTSRYLNFAFSLSDQNLKRLLKLKKRMLKNIFLSKRISLKLTTILVMKSYSSK